MPSKEQFRFATSLELKHFDELMQPLHDYIMANPLDQSEPPTQALIQVFVKVGNEIARFGYFPTRFRLLVKLDQADIAVTTHSYGAREALAKIMGKTP
ncbi:MAG: hypothetical protein WKG03_16725 [Telluria sp.]